MAESREVDRLGAFTDGVIVISMTLLVLDIQLPNSIGNASDAELLLELGSIWPEYLGYLLSFLVIGNYWMLHTAKFRSLTKIDGPFVWLNIFFLLTIGFVPFVTSVISDNGGMVATSLYAAIMATASALLAWMGFHAERRGLVDKPVAPGHRWRHIARSLMTTAVFLVSIIIAQFDPSLARYSWLLLFPAGFCSGPRKDVTGDLLAT